MSTTTNRVRFVVPGEPVPQPRQRHRVVRGVAMNYTPKNHPVWQYKASAARAAEEALGSVPGWDKTAPLAVIVTFVLPRPKRISNKKFPGRIHAPVRPDIDNFQKSLFDGCTEVLWVDDAQIVESTSSKFYAAAGEDPSTSVTVICLRG